MGAFADRETHLKGLEKRLHIGGVEEHESLFKYVSLDGKMSWNYFEKTLSEGQLIGATVNSLNDPFEGQARFIDDLTEEKMRECCIYYDKEGQWADASQDSEFAGIDEMRSMIDKRLQNTLSQARILSFCRRSDSPLLWSHYAKAHTGACLHFSRNAFSDRNLIVGGVSYALHRPVVPMSLLAKIALPPESDHHVLDRRRLREEFYRATFFVKPEDWSYEEEVRIIYSTTRMTNVPFDRQGLFEVVIGARCDLESEQRIRALVDQYSPHVSVRKASIDTDTFSVRFT